MELLDVQLIGGKYTWYKENGMAKSIIDRVLVSTEWLVHWPDSKQYIKGRQMLDHCALLLKPVTIDWGPKTFKTLDIWKSDPAFKKVVKQSWETYIGKGNPMISLKEKLKKLKFDLKSWNRDVFGFISLKKQNLLLELAELDMKDYESNLGDDDKVSRMKLLRKLKLLLHKESALLNQKTRLKWIEEGDTNSKYFHSRIRWRRVTNELKGADVNGTWCEDPTKRMEFCDRWIGWIKECLGSSSVSILVNGSPTKEFIPTRGLRHMAPFLFLIVTKGLAGLMRQAVKKDMYSGIKVCANGVNVGLL
ncbi:uncharacterized protein LOC114175387 [Vigna unguiculata]|uniref:uncharacterized protein LOC114175387 n=1 Tax=Vigna unguiculata TaxID=3917 RepID=UPI001016FA5B|nr:uncharacterized protein LOC114175387 [Vigna unguiculata]